MKLPELVKTLKKIQEEMNEFSRYWYIKGIASQEQVDKYKFKKEEPSDFEGFEFDYKGQWEVSDSGDDFSGTIFLPVAEGEYLHIEWSA